MSAGYLPCTGTSLLTHLLSPLRTSTATWRKVSWNICPSGTTWPNRLTSTTTCGQTLLFSHNYYYARYCSCCVTGVSCHRSILVDWLVEVGEEYKLQTETLFLAVSYIDRYRYSIPRILTGLELDVSFFCCGSELDQSDPAPKIFSDSDFEMT